MLKSTVSGSQIACGGIPFSADTITTREPFAAFDSDIHTSWASLSATPPQMLGYVFTKAVQVVSFDIQSKDNGAYAGETPLTFYLQRSNFGGVTWTTIGTLQTAST